MKLELEPLGEGPTGILQLPESIAPNTVKDMKPEGSKEIPGVRKSSGVNFQIKPDHIPSMTGSNYDAALHQLEYHGIPHLDAHMFFVKIQE